MKYLITLAVKKGSGEREEVVTRRVYVRAENPAAAVALAEIIAEVHNRGRHETYHSVPVGDAVAVHRAFEILDFEEAIALALTGDL